MARRKKTESHLSPLLRRRIGEIEACERRGESLKAYAERRGISPRALYEAKRQARKAGMLPPHQSRRLVDEARNGPPRRFVEAVPSRALDRAPTPDAIAWRLRWPSGAVLESTAPLDEPCMAKILATLGEGA